MSGPPEIATGYIVDCVNAYLDREFGPQRVSVRELDTPEDLQAYESGEMVMYRKPARRFGDRIVYEKNGARVELKQESLRYDEGTGQFKAAVEQ